MKNLLSVKPNPSQTAGGKPSPLNSLGALGQGLAASALTLCFGSLLLAALYCHTQMSSATCHLLQLVVLGLASLAGGLMAGKKAGNRGLYHGLALGLLLLACLCVLSQQAGGLTLLALLVKGLLLLLGCCLGGILGVA